MLKYLLLPAMILLPGCVSTFSDTHHFATVEEGTGQIVNIFRVSVTGGAEMANLRYIAGYYDPRAVDLFFNEVNAENYTDAEAKGAVPSIFRTTQCDDPASEDCRKKQDAVLRIIPVGADGGKQGRFVMILSSNANAVASSIGKFAENELVISSALFLATKNDRETVARLEAEGPIISAQRNATTTEIGNILEGAGTNYSSKYLRTLQAIAAGLAPNAAPAFKDEKEAAAWFAARPRGGQQ